MVQVQLFTLEHLMNSGFGRPFPRHGLQLLFWFANNCVTCELINFVLIIKLVPDCQPENGFYGFHYFGNNEKLLPVLDRNRSPRTTSQVEYFEVGNLNTKTFPAAAHLPTYVRENYGLLGNRGDHNTDRVIISVRVRTRVVETVHVTEHDGRGCGRFSPGRTYEISFELIRALRSPQLDITTFLTQMGYYRDIQGQRLDVDIVGHDQPVPYIGSVTSQNSRLVPYCSELRATRRPRAVAQSYWPTWWEHLYKGFEENADRKKGGGVGGGGGGGGSSGLLKILLSAGALYLAAKCFSCLWGWWKADDDENVLRMAPWRTPSYRHAHVMLDYVY